ncbi:MAG: putative nicotinate-nucleotide adenylyltransferase [Candidatus Mesenet longicola]|uniref:Probable nicotinate-nucleotide adenylyltransferase n=1 Tax=Candidatus Mesenet longicola TaxID=1892558 RepID=A0A8J3MQ27_9RICK|nr:MAG: putative nicotinate-nucleotide adenylyltransferase [Candidatus Mesenet longicola]GHM59112.1 MAG: putative nicotinate-nucleotide adenylyltransferase [Candidatus Mesenet longicola]
MKKLNIGLLGGTFDPPHFGHLYISTKAIKTIGLDCIWWVVAKQNPLKEQSSSMINRVNLAKGISKFSNKIHVIDIEKAVKKSYSYNTVVLLKQKFPHINFIWIMGSDNLTSIHKWYRWQEFCKIVPIAIFERSKLYKEIKCPFVSCFSSFYVRDPKLLLDGPPSWSIIRMKVNPISSSMIRLLTY